MSLSSSGSPVLPFLPFPSLLHKPRLRCAAVSGNRLGEVSSRMLGGGRVGANHSDSENKAYAGQNGGLEALYDDGFGDVSVKDYFDASRAINKPDGGAPRWFCPVECGAPIKGSPLLLFLPGRWADGVGMGLILHHKSLGKASRIENQDAKDTAIVGLLVDPMEARYLPIEGLAAFNKATADLLLGADNLVIPLVHDPSIT
ncbi:hypothetical protein ZIOFF_022455 [Zingiber officinale]|uniref:Uncharacterized protein n=1 Tax=Zingiber officinale TaxID=94328 RepID=A0A8J5H8Y1_ZINOF|nr:hypothetical protein ZIOFF_022455 [Zingiber officinale]